MGYWRDSHLSQSQTAREAASAQRPPRRSPAAEPRRRPRPARAGLADPLIRAPGCRTVSEPRQEPPPHERYRISPRAAPRPRLSRTARPGSTGPDEPRRSSMSKRAQTRSSVAWSAPASRRAVEAAISAVDQSPAQPSATPDGDQPGPIAASTPGSSGRNGQSEPRFDAARRRPDAGRHSTAKNPRLQRVGGPPSIHERTIHSRAACSEPTARRIVRGGTESNVRYA